jgi:hypothetical protein
MYLIFLYGKTNIGDKMKKRKNYESYDELTKRVMNEISSEDVIFDEVQTGPQEEVTFQEFKLDLDKFNEYKKRMKSSK